MSGLNLEAYVNVSGTAVIRHVVFPKNDGGLFAQVQLHDANSGVSLLITDPYVLAALAETAQAARADLLAATTPAFAARTAE